MYEEGLLTDGFMLEFLQSHTNVVAQPPGGRLNPYALGFAMMRDIRRICEAPTDEDRLWFPDIAGSDWQKTLDYAMRNFKDESFIGQFLSPELMRQFRLFAIRDDAEQPDLEVSAIHDEAGYRHLRESLARQYDINHREPNIQVRAVDTRGDRSLTLRHQQEAGRPLDDDADEVLKHVARLWGFRVVLESLDASGRECKRREVYPARDR
jgi:stage V sporulation protein R